MQNQECIQCGVLVYPQFDVPYYSCAQEYYQCQKCQSVYCSRDAHLVKTATKGLNSTTERKNAEFYAFDGSIVEMGSVTEDEEPRKAVDANCVFCGSVQLFTVHLQDCQSDCCKRCKSFYDKCNEQTCAMHSGNHEMPMDRQNEFVFANLLSDIGGQMHICSVTPFMYPGRWTCCGTLCYHDIPQCPYYNVNQQDGHSLAQHAQENSNYLGCESATHTHVSQSYSHLAHPDISQMANSYIQTGEYKGVGVGTVPIDWRRLVTWNAGVPHHYPSGVLCPDSVVALGEDGIDKYA